MEYYIVFCAGLHNLYMQEVVTLNLAPLFALPALRTQKLTFGSKTNAAPLLFGGISPVVI